MVNVLNYNHPATEYISGNPYGGGSIAAMAFTSSSSCRFALNHEALWRAKFADRECNDVADKLPLVRDCLLKGDYDSAKILTNHYFAGRGALYPRGRRMDPYQPAGDLVITSDGGDFTDYLRTLNMETAVFNSKYVKNGIAHKLTSFIDINSSVFALRLTSDKKNDLDVILERQRDSECSISYEFFDNKNAFAMHGRFSEGKDFTLYAEIVTDGGTERKSNGLAVSGATKTDIFLTIDVSDTAIVPEASSFEKLYDSQTKEFSKRFNSFSISLDGEESDLTTDERVRLFHEGGEPLMPITYFNFGRYLMICGSSGKLPLNLQGKWNYDLKPGWNCDYHNNINLQMNYWFAETLGFSDCHEIMLDFILSMEAKGREAAKKLYGCRGIYLSLTTDVSGSVTPESFGYGAWLGAAPWYCAHLMQHYEYTLDLDYLKNKAYPFMKGTAEFFEDYLVDVNGMLEIMPSQSPENSFKEAGPDKEFVSICISSAMDVELVTELLEICIRASEILGADEEKREKWADMLKKLSKLQIGSDGRLLEWGQEFTENEPGHRHFSHLYGLHPGTLFRPGDKYYKAAEKSLDFRLSHGGGYTGWSRSWVACLMARLNRGADAYEHIRALICDFATESLLDLHPPRIFQIDGNMGGTSAICELLWRDCYGELELLPGIEGLPKEWQSGSVKGAKLRGGKTLDFTWKDGKVVEKKIY